MPTYRANIGISYPGAGGPGLNTWHFRHEAVASLTLSGVMGVLEDFYTAVQSIYPTGTSISGPPEVIEDPYGEPTYAAVTPWEVLGTGGGGQAPPQTQLVVTWRTTTATRSGRGRSFLGPINNGLISTDGTVDPSGLAAVQAAAAALVSTSLGDGNWAFGVYSRTNLVLRDFVSSRVRDEFSVLRSRRD